MPGPDRILKRLRAATLLVAPCIVATAAAQAPGFGRGGPPAGPARDTAPVDLTGTWVSLVTEDWIERMSPDSPASGSGGFGRGGGFGGGFGGRGGVPVPASSDPCRAYAAGGIMRMPGRVRISWEDDDTLLLEYDAGSQVRRFRFGDSGEPPAGNALQGASVASWSGGASGGRGGRGGGRPGGFGAPGGSQAGPAPDRWGSLDVVTTNLSGGYLLTSRSNYGAGAVLTEHVRYHHDFGNEYFTVTAIIEEGDSTSSMASSTFKKEPNGSRFNPTACEIVP